MKVNFSLYGRAFSLPGEGRAGSEDVQVMILSNNMLLLELTSQCTEFLESKRGNLALR